jgi:phage/plasmid primase-like uncharacterized protein
MNMTIENHGSTPEERFERAMNAAGLYPDKPLKLDGEIQRFATSNKRHDSAGWYVYNPGPPAHGAFGCHRADINQSWVDDEHHYPDLTTEEFQVRASALSSDFAEKEKTLRLKAKETAFTNWKDANDDPTSHDYLLRKQVGAHGIRRKDNKLVVPLYNADSELCSLLKILPDGTKRFLTGGAVSGCYHIIGEPGETICVAEGYATAAAIHESTNLPVYVAMTANNLLPVAKQVRKFYFNATLIICADDDYQTEGNPGLTKAEQAARAVGGLVAVPDFCAYRPEGATDFNDLLLSAGAQAVMTCVSNAKHPGAGESGDSGETPPEKARTPEQGEGNGANGLAKNISDNAVRRATELLITDIVPDIDYPITALGPLADACKAISDGVQINPAIVGQSLLAAASLLAQSIANATTADGSKPLSLNLLTIAESGDGKSTAEYIALAAVNQFQREESANYREALTEYEKKLRSTKRGEDPPVKPMQPYLLMRDATVEGIRRSFLEGHPSQGLFTSEAAVILHGYGMSAEQRAKTAANLNALWDSGELSVARSTGERVQLYDRRFAMHWMIQPSAAASGLTDPLLTEIGLWPRFLVAWPSAGHPRKWAPFDPGKDPAIGTYWKRCTELLSLGKKEDCSELKPIISTQSAQRLFAEFFEDIERQAKQQDGKLQDIRIFASRATEQAIRIAGVLTVFAGQEEVTPDMARNAISLVKYSLSTWLAIHGEKTDNDHRLRAIRLYSWLLNRRNMRSDTTAILQVGPKPLRSRARRDAALALLKNAGLVIIDMKEVQAALPSPAPAESTGGN